MTAPVDHLPGYDDTTRLSYNIHFVWWGYLAVLSLVIALVGEPIPAIDSLGPERLTPITWTLSTFTVAALIFAFLNGGPWVTRFAFAAGAFFLWRGVSLFYSTDPYAEVRMFVHTGHVLSLFISHLTYGILRTEKGVP